MVDDDKASNGSTIGWPDVVLALPKWLVAIAFFTLVSVVAYTFIWSKDTVKLGFLGEWGRSPQEQPNTLTAIPKGSVIASTEVCDVKAGWEPFAEGTGRFLVGAGDNVNPGYANWMLEGVSLTKLSQYKALDLGGEERHLIKIAESPQVIPKPRNDYGGNHDTGGTESVAVKQQTATINILPPYVGVFFCKKK